MYSSWFLTHWHWLVRRLDLTKSRYQRLFSEKLKTHDTSVTNTFAISPWNSQNGNMQLFHTCRNKNSPYLPEVTQINFFFLSNILSSSKDILKSPEGIVHVKIFQICSYLSYFYLTKIVSNKIWTGMHAPTKIKHT